MADVLKVLGVEQACNTTSNTFGSAHLVRLINTSNVSISVAEANSSANVTQFTLGAYEIAYVQKDRTNGLLSANNTVVLAVPVAFTN